MTMADTAILVEGLSKSYIIRHADREKYFALRDVLARTAGGIIKGVLHARAPRSWWRSPSNWRRISRSLTRLGMWTAN